MDRDATQSRPNQLNVSRPVPRLTDVHVPQDRCVRVYIGALGLFAPGFASWAEGRHVLAGAVRYRDRGLPPMDRVKLPPNETRRVTLSVKLALQLAAEPIAAMGALPDRLATVFACSGGNSEALSRLLDGLSEGMVSPNQFAHLSHNAAGGYWSIVHSRPHATTSLGAYDGTFAAGLIEAATQAAIDRCSVLFVASDAPPPKALHRCRPIRGVFGASLVLTPSPRALTCAARLELTLASGENEDRLDDPALESLRRDNPAARGLPLFMLIARRRPGRVVLPLHADMQLVARYEPC